MRKLLVLSLSLLLGASAFAEDVFYPGFQWGLKGGAGYTIGETNDMSRLLSGAASIDLGYQFSRLFTLRADISGWEGKGVNCSYNWRVDYVQLAADAKFDIINMFAKKYKSHVVNPYVFVGLGGQYRYYNSARVEKLPPVNHLKDFRNISYVGRVGAGIDFKVCNSLAIVLEFVENATDDTFNSKVGDYFDHQMDLLLGVNFRFGQAKKIREGKAAAEKAAADAAAAEAAAAAARVAAEKAAAEKAAAEAMALAEAQAAAAKKAAEEAEAAKKAVITPEYAQAAAVAAFKDSDNNIYYGIGKSEISSAQSRKVANLVKKLNENPEAKAIICGYADKETGTSKINMTLSENRANKVKAALVAAGIAPERILTFAFGDTARVSDTASKNRVSVLIAE